MTTRVALLICGGLLAGPATACLGPQFESFGTTYRMAPLGVAGTVASVEWLTDDTGDFDRTVPLVVLAVDDVLWGDPRGETVTFFGWARAGRDPVFTVGHGLVAALTDDGADGFLPPSIRDRVEGAYGVQSGTSCNPVYVFPDGSNGANRLRAAAR